MINSFFGGFSSAKSTNNGTDDGTANNADGSNNNATIESISKNENSTTTLHKVTKQPDWLPAHPSQASGGEESGGGPFTSSLTSRRNSSFSLADAGAENPHGNSSASVTMAGSAALLDNGHAGEGNDTDKMAAASATVLDTIQAVRITEAIRRGNIATLQDVLAEYNLASIPLYRARYGTLLHLAAAYGSVDIFTELIRTGIDVNAKSPIDDATVLHVVARLGRNDLLTPLLSLPAIDDTLRDAEGHTAIDVAKNKQLASIIEYQRHGHLERALKEMHACAHRGDEAGLRQIFTHPRNHTLLNFNALDAHGDSVLHIAAKMDRLSMVQLCLEFGVDPFLKNRRGKVALELARDDAIKSALLEAPMVPSKELMLDGSRKLEGFLLKWTNYAEGYKKRWFVLEDGILSYYKSQADYPVSCRGSVNVEFVEVVPHLTDRFRFEINGLNNSTIRYHLRAGNAGDAKRWVIGVNQVKDELSKAGVNITASSNSMAAPLMSEGTRGFRAYEAPTVVTTHDGALRMTVQTALGQLDAHAKLIKSMREYVLTREQNRSEKRGSFFQDSNRSSDNDYDDGDDERQIDANAVLHPHGIPPPVTATMPLSPAAPLAALPSAASSKLIVDEFFNSAMSINNSLREALLFCDDRESFWQQKYANAIHDRHLLEESLKVLAVENSKMEIWSRRRAMADEASGIVPLPDVNDEFFDAIEDTILYTDDEDEEDGIGRTTTTTTTISGKSTVSLNGSTTSTYDNGYSGQCVAKRAGISSGSAPNAVTTPKEIGSCIMAIASPVAVAAPLVSGLAQAEAPAPSLVDLSFVKADLQGYTSNRRTIIPADSSTMPPVSLWSIVKNAIGKDLTRIPMPINFCEPLSMLQRMCEDVEYVEALSSAAVEKNSLLRIQHIAAFAASGYASTDGRVTKPFNPLLGETFEYVSHEHGFRYVSEQVSHHPPISACYCEAPNYIYWNEVNVKSKFWGKSFELTPEGISHVLLNGNEHYSWKKVATSVNNIIVGRLWIDHHGTLRVKNHSTGEVCELVFHQTGWRAAHAKKVTGSVYDAQGTVRYTIAGFWNSHLVSTEVANGGKSFELWRRHTLPPNSDMMYHFSRFTATLNEMPDSLVPYLCPTDSRLRPDQRAMENGQFDVANRLKCDLEELQRARRKESAALSKADDDCGGSHQHTPRWFVQSIEPDTNESQWEFLGGYWESRARQTWSGCPNLYDLAPN